MSEPIKTKHCCRCKKIKEVSEFYKSNIVKDGFQASCKTCMKAYKQSQKYKDTEKRYNDSKKHRDAVDSYQQSKKGQETLRMYKESEKFKLRAKCYQQSDIRKHPEKHKARNAISNAIKEGWIPAAKTLKCSCNKQAEQYHHFKGYAEENWFDVIPVCRICHGKLRRQLE